MGDIAFGLGRAQEFFPAGAGKVQNRGLLKLHRKGLLFGSGAFAGCFGKLCFLAGALGSALPGAFLAGAFLAVLVLLAGVFEAALAGAFFAAGFGSALAAGFLAAAFGLAAVVLPAVFLAVVLGAAFVAVFVAAALVFGFGLAVAM